MIEVPAIAYSFKSSLQGIQLFCSQPCWLPVLFFLVAAVLAHGHLTGNTDKFSSSDEAQKGNFRFQAFQ